MPATGLPSAVEKLLATLMTDHRVVSWKVTGEGEQSVIVIRLTSCQQDGTAPLPTGHWRRKAPAQVRRDQQRAAQRRAQLQQRPQRSAVIKTDTVTTGTDSENNHDTKMSDNATIINNVSDNNIANNNITMTPRFCDKTNDRDRKQRQGHLALQASEILNSPSDLFMPSPDYVHNYDTPSVSGRNALRDVTQCSASAARMSCIDTCTTVSSHACGEMQLGRSVLCTDKMQSRENCDDETEELYLERLATELGYDAEELKTYVCSLTDRPKLTQLRDARRNKCIRKGVVDTRGGREVLICESEDIVLHYDCKTEERGWFIKPSSNNQPRTAREDDLLSCLYRWPQVDDPKYDHHFMELDKDLVITAKLVRLLLG